MLVPHTEDLLNLLNYVLKNVSMKHAKIVCQYFFWDPSIHVNGMTPKHHLIRTNQLWANTVYLDVDMLVSLTQPGGAQEEAPGFKPRVL